MKTHLIAVKELKKGCDNNCPYIKENENTKIDEEFYCLECCGKLQGYLSAVRSELEFLKDLNDFVTYDTQHDDKRESLVYQRIIKRIADCKDAIKEGEA